MENSNRWSALSLSTKIKYITVVVIAILFTVFITQNLEKVELDVLFWTFNVRFVFALIFCFLIGVLITYFWMKIRFSKKMKEKKAQENAQRLEFDK